MAIRDFLYFGKTLKDNHKLITISILHFQNIIKMRFYPFFENMDEKLLGFGRMHENKIYFLCFLK
jgi:hypothetical protein